MFRGIHLSLFIFRFWLLSNPPSYYNVTTINLIRDWLFFIIVTLSFCGISYARKALIFVALSGIHGALYYFYKDGLIITILGIAYYGLVMYFSVSKRYDHHFSKWGVFEKKQAKDDSTEV